MAKELQINSLEFTERCSLAVTALRACVSIYLRQFNSFRTPMLWFIDLNVASCHIHSCTFLSECHFYFVFTKNKWTKHEILKVKVKWLFLSLCSESKMKCKVKKIVKLKCQNKSLFLIEFYFFLLLLLLLLLLLFLLLLLDDLLLLFFFFTLFLDGQNLSKF